ncbi:MAG: hypothetical protein IJM13_07270 [Lachnospiraceae bacterium]|nr:hypothetical protein [Lachnospiraceae bacterium]MBR0402860.1 hypothetical protein [Lachnospiraceae bacterium]
MPYIKLTTTKKLTHEQQQALSEGLTEAAKQIPGKEIIFLFIEDGKTVFLGNVEQADLAFLEFDLTGHFSTETKQAFAKEAYAVITRVTGTSPRDTSMRITEHDTWGCFGGFCEYDDSGFPKPES